MKSAATVSCLCLALFMTPAAAVTAKKTPAQAPAKKVPVAPTPASAAPVAQVPAVTPANQSLSAPLPMAGLGVVPQAAARSGVIQCLPRMDQVVNFLSATAQTGAMVFVAPGDADRRQASIGLEVLGGNGLSYIDTTYSPSANGCDATYAQVTYWENSCIDLVKSGFPGFTRVNQMRQHIGVLDGGPSAKVFLMPAGTGCVSIKKEVLY